MEKPTYYLWRVWYRSINYLGDIVRGRRVRWFIQRRKRGFDDRELWGLDQTIAEFVYPRIKAFRETQHIGCATCFFPEGSAWDQSSSDEDWAIASKNKEEALLAMEMAFKYMVADGLDLDDGLGEMSTEDNLVAFPDKDETKWEAYRAESERRDKVIESGLATFAKYFRTLWD
jgi:hypothetical protein